MVLSGAWQIGMRLPAERDLAAQLNISRPVLHQALVDLAAKGLVRIEPRRGVFINDYRTSGSCALISSLLSYKDGDLDSAFVQSLMEMRLLIETETAALAAKNRSYAHLCQLHVLLVQEDDSPLDNSALVEMDFSLHLQVAIASGNLVYPLIINSFKGVYTHLTGQFFEQYINTSVVKAVFDFHHRLVNAIDRQDSASSADIMREMLQHGVYFLKKIP